MDYQSAFNNEILSLIKSKESTAYKTIHALKEKFPQYKDYYSMIDSLSFKLGIVFLTQEVSDKNDRTIGYIPLLKYYPENRINENPRTERLNNDSPCSLIDCYRFLAKETLYRLMRITNLTKVLID